MVFVGRNQVLENGCCTVSPREMVRYVEFLIRASAL